MSAPAPSPLADLSSSLASIVAGASPSLVSVQSRNSVSSGFIWKAGLVVTADEPLAEDGDVAVVLNGGEAIPAKIVGRDPTTDLALLRIGRFDLPAATLADSIPAVGSLVAAVGSQDGAATAALGIVGRSSGAWRSVRGGEIGARVDLDLRLRRSAEGGLAVDAGGQAFGMAVSGPRRTTLVIPSATIDRVASILEQHGRVPRGYLGLGLQPVTLTGTKEAGAMVVSVDPKGPGAAAGLLQGDILVARDGAPLGGMRALLGSLGPDSVGKETIFTIRRGGEPSEIRLTVGERLAN